MNLTKLAGRARDHPLLASVGFALAWTLLGIAVAAISGSVSSFLLEWVRLQGTIDLTIGTWLALDATSHPLPVLLRNLGMDHVPGRGVRVAQILILCGVTGIGSASLIALGFNGKGGVLVFLCLTCVIICGLAALATWHGVEILIASREATNTNVHVFVYSPAETKELRFLARHATTFAAVLTLGYAFTLAGTLLSGWTGNPVRVRTVVTFWPTMYVPFCLLLLSYPQLQFRKLIRREKERLLSVCQKSIDDVLKKDDLTTDDVQRCNALAELFDKVAATPEYVIDVGIVAKAVWIVAVNAVTLILPREMIVKILRAYFSARARRCQRREI